jgi:hypothetical protein
MLVIVQSFIIIFNARTGNSGISGYKKISFTSDW